MATVPPPPSKRRRTVDGTLSSEETSLDLEGRKVIIQFQERTTGINTGRPVLISIADATQKNLSYLLNNIEGNELILNAKDASSRLSYQFTRLIRGTKSEEKVSSTKLIPHDVDAEVTQIIQHEPESLFRVKAVSRCGATMSAGRLPILCAQFSPATSSRLLTGIGATSGADSSARIWDCDTGTNFKKLTGHTSSVIAVSWSPDGTVVATGSRDKTVRLWDPATGEAKGGPMTGHGEWITSFAWEPYHLCESGNARLASASKDATVRIWNTVLRRVEIVLCGHAKSVVCVKWGGTGSLYTSSQDHTIKIWKSDTGELIRTLKGHSHWVTSLALSTDHALRTAYHEYGKPIPGNEAAKKELALSRYKKAAPERLVSGSDDTTLCLWNPSEPQTTPISKMHGHQKVVIRVAYSPNGAFIASAGFDNLVKLWNGRDGSFLATFKGHVSDVFQVSFSADSRLLVSGSKDTTLKVWDIKARKLKEDLPGHQDEVLVVDWSPDGEKVASGGRDGKIKLWRH
ncbi:MAG: hypothetical protein M1814_003258 [Vezdaea aestivalis]|nr:MAG: hypothetical protein M1814_003258 [Vezdaea aestivalis]